MQVKQALKSVGKYLIRKRQPGCVRLHDGTGSEKILVLLNFKGKPALANKGIDISKAKLLLGNYSTSSKDGKLQPQEAVIYEL